MARHSTKPGLDIGRRVEERESTPSKLDDATSTNNYLLIYIRD
jgi:hypothetical protein